VLEKTKAQAKVSWAQCSKRRSTRAHYPMLARRVSNSCKCGSVWDFPLLSYGCDDRGGATHRTKSGGGQPEDRGHSDRDFSALRRKSGQRKGGSWTRIGHGAGNRSRRRRPGQARFARRRKAAPGRRPRSRMRARPPP
jgi:hypothetical protein